MTTDILQNLNQGAWYFFWVRGLVLLLEVGFLLRKKGLHSDILPNIACGLMIFAFLKFLGSGLTFAFMTGIATFATRSLEFSFGLLLLTILAADLSYYIAHRLSHTLRFMWADHSVHHSSQEFDFSTSLRGSVVNGLYSWLPLTPLLLLGVNPLLVVWCRALVNDYTFFLHTQYVGKLGWLEWVLNTPSHHRVHHACNSVYVDKNFGFLLIVWDRLFGTFAVENERCRYGTTTPVTSRNPVKVMFHGWTALWLDLLAARGLHSKARVALRMTGEPTPPVSQEFTRKLSSTVK